jgi:hypothetical protein
MICTFLRVCVSVRLSFSSTRAAIGFQPAWPFKFLPLLSRLIRPARYSHWFVTFLECRFHHTYQWHWVRTHLLCSSFYRILPFCFIPCHFALVGFISNSLLTHELPLSHLVFQHWLRKARPMSLWSIGSLQLSNWI